MFQGVERWRKNVFAGMLFLLAGVGTTHVLNDYLKNRADIAHKRDKKEAKMKLAADYGVGAPASQAVFILPPPGEKDDYWKVRPYELRDEFIKNKIPAFVVGDTSGKASLGSIEGMIKDIQEKNGFEAITFLSLTHGNVVDSDNGYRAFDSTTAIKQWDAWKDYPKRTRHTTMIARNATDPVTEAVMKSIVSASGAKKVDWVSFSCFSGAVDQRIINQLPTGSTYIAMSGGGQVNYFEAQRRMLEDVRAGKTQFEDGINATDFLVETLQENWRDYGADVVIGVSGGEDVVTIFSENRNNHTAQLNSETVNKKQIERAKKTKIKKAPKKIQARRPV